MKLKERSLNEVSKKLANAQSYIFTLEKKVEDLERSLALQQLNVHASSQNEGTAKPTTMSTSLFENIEVKLIESRLSILESKFIQLSSNNDKNIVINNNYGSGCQQQDCKTSGSAQNADQISASNPNTIQVKVPDQVDVQDVNVENQTQPEIDNLPPINSTGVEDESRKTKFLGKNQRHKKPPRMRRKNLKSPQIPNITTTHQPNIYPNHPVLMGQPLFYQPMRPLVNQSLLPPSTWRTSQQIPFIF